jgi:hypothetical protein
MIVEILEVVFHFMGLIIMGLMVFISIKFIISYRYSKENVLVGGVIFSLTFLAALFYFTLRFFLGLFGIDISVDYRTSLFVIYGVDFLVLISWFYIIFQLLYSQSTFIKICFFVVFILNILWEVFFFYMIFFSSISTQNAEFIVILYDIVILSLSAILILFLAIKSLLSTDNILRVRGVVLIIGLLLCFISLLFEDGYFTPELAIIDTIMRIILVVGVSFLFLGFFISEESKIYKILITNNNE